VPGEGAAKASGLMKNPLPPETKLPGSSEAPAKGSPTVFGRLAWFPPVKLLSAAVTVKGRPVWMLTIELTCHPPRMWLARFLSERNRFPGPNGRA
jgi:hypothetical protein